MTCVRIPGGILMLSDECRPFKIGRQWWSVSKQVGPFRCKQNGDPAADQLSRPHEFDAAHEYYLANIKGKEGDYK